LAPQVNRRKEVQEKYRASDKEFDEDARDYLRSRFARQNIRGRWPIRDFFIGPILSRTRETSCAQGTCKTTAHSHFCLLARRVEMMRCPGAARQRRLTHTASLR
jgi:hypothetical protein